MKYRRKDNDEIQADKRKRYFDIRKPLLSFFIIFILSCVISWMPYRRIGMADFDIISLNDFINKSFPYSIFLGFVAFVVAYIWNIANNAYPFFEESYVCEYCGKRSESKYYINCECGGQFLRKSHVTYCK